MNDAFTEAINAPVGRLTEVLIKKSPKTSEDGAFSDELLSRFDRLIDAPAHPGFLARVRLAAEVSSLFERAPDWTRAKIVPLFDWSNPMAANAWDARRYASYIGSPELISLTKQAFLNLFGRADISDEAMRAYAEWLVVIQIANRRKDGIYPISPRETRAALRQAGSIALRSVAHQLATEMESVAAEQKLIQWRTIVGPIFQEIWPLDVELQSSSLTFKLVQILRASGDAFSEAVDVIIPFVRPDEDKVWTTVYSIAEAPNTIYDSAPRKVLELLSAVVADAPPKSVHSLDKALTRVRESEPALANTREFQKLLRNSEHQR